MPTSPSAHSVSRADLVDPRGPRFAAAITSVLLAAALILGPAVGVVPLAIQTLAFASGALLGVQRQPWGWLFRKAVRPRLAAPEYLEDAAAPRFAQAVGLLFGFGALAGALLDVPALFYTFGAFALVAALLNAVTGFCLGCEIHVLARRLVGRRNGGQTA